MEKKNSSYKHQLLCKGPAGPECQVVEHGHVHFLPPGTATTNNWHHKQELEAFLEWLHGSYNLRYNFRKCMLFDACGSWWQTTSKCLPIIWNFMVDMVPLPVSSIPKPQSVSTSTAKDGREGNETFRHPRLRRKPGSFWVVASMSSTSLHHPTNNQSSWSCCNKVSGMPLTNSTSFSWIPEWLAASNQYTPENKRLEITNSGVRNVSFRGCRVFWEICKRKKPDIYSNLHGRSWILIWKLLYLMAIWYKVGIHIHG